MGDQTIIVLNIIVVEGVRLGGSLKTNKKLKRQVTVGVKIRSTRQARYRAQSKIASKIKTTRWTVAAALSRKAMRRLYANFAHM